MERRRYLKLGINILLQNYRLSIKQEPKCGYIITPMDWYWARKDKNQLTINRLKNKKLQ